MDELLRVRSIDGDGSSMHAIASDLHEHRLRRHPERVVGILTAWDQLSEACHHHAYELVPSQNEVFGLVRRLVALAS